MLAERGEGVAARSRRRAALSGTSQTFAAGRAHGADRRRPALCACASTWRRAGAGPLTWPETGSGPAGESGTVAAEPHAWGDVVLARKETPTSYHLVVVVDDALQGVTHVVRGQDLFWSTSVHRASSALLDLPAPTYHHHGLVLDAQGRKLSKSTRSTALRELRAQGATANDIRRMVGLGGVPA